MLKVTNEAFDSILIDWDYKTFKKKHSLDSKDVTVETFQNLLGDTKRLSNDIEILFPKDIIRIGPFAFDVSHLKSELIDKTNERDKKLLEKIRKKCDEAAKTVKDTVKMVVAELTKGASSYKNIEDVDETKQFLKQLDKKRQDIRALT